MQSSFKTYNLMVKMFSERLGRDNRPRRRKWSWCGGGGFFISRLEKKTKPKKNRRMVSQVELLNFLGRTPKKHKKGDAMRFSESVLLGLFIFELNQTVTKLTWMPKMMVWEMYLLLNITIFGIYAKLVGCTS